MQSLIYDGPRERRAPPRTGCRSQYEQGLLYPYLCFLLSLVRCVQWRRSVMQDQYCLCYWRWHSRRRTTTKIKLQLIDWHATVIPNHSRTAVVMLSITKLASCIWEPQERHNPLMLLLSASICRGNRNTIPTNPILKCNLGCKFQTEVMLGEDERDLMQGVGTRDQALGTRH